MWHFLKKVNAHISLSFINVRVFESKQKINFLDHSNSIYPEATQYTKIQISAQSLYSVKGFTFEQVKLTWTSMAQL